MKCEKRILKKCCFPKIRTLYITLVDASHVYHQGSYEAAAN